MYGVREPMGKTTGVFVSRNVFKTYEVQISLVKVVGDIHGFRSNSKVIKKGGHDPQQ